MRGTGQSHPCEEDFERYSLGHTTQEESATFEEHLLLCAGCRIRLDQTDAYHRGVQAAARTVRKQGGTAKVIRFPVRLAWAVAAGLALLGAELVYQGAPRPASVPAMQVVLEATRGPLTAAPANRSLRLRPDLSGLPAFDRYHLEMVDTHNATLWQGTVPAQDPQVTVTKRAPGTYFVRVYSPARELLREYGLEVKR